MRTVYIFTNPSYQCPSVNAQVRRLTEELLPFANVKQEDAQVVLDGSGRVSVVGRSGLIEGGTGIYLDKDPYLAVALERVGVRLLNSAESIALCDNKILTHYALEGFSMPPTVVGRMCYSGYSYLSDVVRGLGFPMVYKPACGSLGMGVRMVASLAELEAVLQTSKGDYLLQEYAAHSVGRDVRAVVVGGKMVASIVREGGFVSNIAMGGKGSVLGAKEEQAVSAIAVAVADRLGLNYCGVDLLYGKNGFMVCEVNSNAFFEETERVSGVNVALEIARFLVADWA